MANAEYIKQWRINKRQAGLCQSCGVNQHVHKSSKCEQCKTSVNEKRRLRYATRKTHGNCVRCGKSTVRGRHCENCKIDDRIYKARSNLKLKIEVFNYYGGKCNCCGESMIEFLTLDHINNDGAKQRALMTEWESKGVGFYKWVKRNSYPLDLQIMCWNCNCGKNFNGGVCPHQNRTRLNDLWTTSG